MFKDILKLVEKHKLVDKVTLKEGLVIVRDTATQNPHSVHRQTYQGTAKTQVDAEELQKLNKDIEATFPDVELVFEKSLQGGKFSNYGEIDKVFGQGTATLAAVPGQVLLVDVWATWCGPCQNPMKHNQEMIVKNQQKWGNKVRIVGVSVDENKDQIIQRVNSKGWQKVEHLTLGGWKAQHKLISQFKIQGIPFICLVDTNGMVDYIGHPSGVKLEERINSLLSGNGGEKKEAEKEEDENQQVSLETIGRIEKLMGQQRFHEVFAGSQGLAVVAIVHQNSNYGRISNSAKVQVTVMESKKQYLQKLKNEIGDLKGIQYKEIIIESEQIPAGTNCVECGKVFGNQFYYWCKWEDNKQFRCIECTEKKTPDGKYHYNKNSILTNGKPFMTSKKRLGNNILPPAPLQDNCHNFGCNGCHSGPSPNTARYICIGCRPEPNHKGDYIDVCQSCITKYLAGDEDVKENLKPEGHNNDHPFLRVLYNVEGYYKY